jgi:D-alanine-D-alanine ligase
MGGTSAEREVSLVSGKAVAEGLRQAGENVCEVVANDRQLAELDRLSPDVVFIALHGTWGEDGGVQELLERKGLPYTGSGVGASRRGMDKGAAKAAFALRGVPTPRHVTFSAGEPPEGLLRRVRPLGYPLVVKPRAQGSSIGVHIVHEPGQLTEAVGDALAYGQDVLLEEFISGREFTVGILGHEALPIIELRTGREFFDFEAKYQHGATEHVFDVPLSPESYRHVQQVALEAFRAVGCRGFGRVDLRVTETGRPFILEVNTIPGFTPVSLFPDAARRRGLAFPELCVRLVDLALRDHAHARETQLTRE